METKKQIKICPNSHHFSISSDCPVCPICEAQRKPKDDFFSSLAAPAIRALENNRICTLEQLHEDRITMRVMPPGKTLQLIFHRGSKKPEQPKAKLNADTIKMFVWKENDREIISFKSMREIEKGKVKLANIVCDWIDAAK